MSGLVIMRRKDEKFFIGDNITITVVELRAGSVRLLVDAPRDMPILREEIVDDSALRAKRQASVENLRAELKEAERKLMKVQGDESDVSDLGRKRGEFLEADEVADYIESTMIDEGV